MTFSIVKNKKLFFLLSAVILIIGLGSVIFQGFNLDIDFVGGTTMDIETRIPLDRAELDKIESEIQNIIGYKPNTQKSGDEGTIVIIKAKELSVDEREDIFTALSTTYNLTDDDKLSVQNVSATVGKELAFRALLSILAASALMLVYITIRFEFITGLVAVLMLLQDVFVMLTFYTLFQIPINSSVIAAILTIVGYSINGTIIIFDRIRENKKLHPREHFPVLVDTSIAQTFGRSINTTITTLLTISMLYIFGVNSIRNFALPLIIGIISGFYSSVFLAGSMWATLKDMKLKTKKA